MATECNDQFVKSAVKGIFGMPKSADETIVGLRGNCIDQGSPTRAPLSSE
tara:strand:- start:423 stop:572 length:150 start_codon:yes stop_codon:yes gene_type:complete